MNKFNIAKKYSTIAKNNSTIVKQIKQSTIDQQSEVIDRDRFEGSYKHQDDEQQAQSGNVLYFEMDSNYSPQTSVEDPIRHNKQRARKQTTLTLNPNVVEISIENTSAAIMKNTQLIKEENLNQCLELLKNYRTFFEQLV